MRMKEPGSCILLPKPLQNINPPYPQAGMPWPSPVHEPAVSPRMPESRRIYHTPTRESPRARRRRQPPGAYVTAALLLTPFRRRKTRSPASASGPIGRGSCPECHGDVMTCREPAGLRAPSRLPDPGHPSWHQPESEGLFKYRGAPDTAWPERGRAASAYGEINKVRV